MGYLLGAGVNALTIALCGFAGHFLLKGLPGRFEELIKKALALSIIFMGISGAMQNQSVMLLIVSMVAGSILGEWIDIDRRMTALGELLKNKLGFGKGDFSQGFASSSILFCTGSMAIIGGMNSGLSGDHEMLFAKSILDGTFSIVCGASMGIGVAFSAVPVFLYEGLIALGAGFVKNWITPEIIVEMSAVGSLVIAGIGFNFLDVKPIKVANMMPAIFLPWLLLTLQNLLHFEIF